MSSDFDSFMELVNKHIDTQVETRVKAMEKISEALNVAIKNGKNLESLLTELKGAVEVLNRITSIFEQIVQKSQEKGSYIS